MNALKPYKTLLFILGVIAMLALVCSVFPKEGITIGGITLRMPSIASVLAGPKTEPEVDIEQLEAERMAKVEEMMCAELSDSLVFYADFIADSSRGFALPGNDPHFFDTFFAKAEKAAAEGRVVRILHYGDSQIEMDRMSDVLRAYMQETFGGRGAGLLPFSQTIPCTSVSQYATGDYTRYASYGDSTVSRNHGLYGPMAKCCRVNSTASANITCTKSDTRDEHLKSFSKVTVLFDNLSGNLSITVTAKGVSRQQFSTETGVGSLSWQFDTSITSARISVSGMADIYGIMVDDRYGVSVDNISMRGASGHQIQMIDSARLAQSFALMDVGLIIFQYGGNSVPYLYSEVSRERYANEMARQLRILHHTCPNAQILFIGPADMCHIDEEGELHTYPHLEKVVQRLRQVALDNNAAFWSMYDVMGGKGAMSTWVKNGLGGGDYLHFSEKGAKKMAGYLVDAFKTMYGLYTLQKDYDIEKFDKLWQENVTLQQY